MKKLLRKLWPPGEVPGKVARLAGTKPAVQRLLVPLGRELSPEKWIFLVGCYNSGTTLLWGILGNHPNISVMSDEGTFMTDALPKPEDFGWTRMWCQCLDAMEAAQWEDGAAQAARVRRQWSIWFPRDYENLLDKSPSNVTRMTYLQEHFRPASFICIVRNGYAVAEGIRRRVIPVRPEHPGRYPLELCAKQWSDCDRIVRSQESSVERLLQIHYEDLVGDPEGTMRSITDFLGLPAFEKAGRESASRLELGVGDSRWPDLQAARKRIGAGSFGSASSCAPSLPTSGATESSSRACCRTWSQRASSRRS
jgi:hypothetical protein